MMAALHTRDNRAVRRRLGRSSESMLQWKPRLAAAMVVLALLAIAAALGDLDLGLFQLYW